MTLQFGRLMASAKGSLPRWHTHTACWGAVNWGIGSGFGPEGLDPLHGLLGLPLSRAAEFKK